MTSSNEDNINSSYSTKAVRDHRSASITVRGVSLNPTHRAIIRRLAQHLIEHRDQGDETPEPDPQGEDDACQWHLDTPRTQPS